MLHERLRRFKGGFTEALNQPFGSACFHRCTDQNRRRLAGGTHSARVRADDDGVARFEGYQSLGDDGRRRVRRGNERGDNSDRNAVLDDLLLRDLPQHADGLHLPYRPGEKIRTEKVLGDLVFDVAVRGFFDSKFGKRSCIGATRGSDALNYRVDLLLAELAVLLPRGVGLFDLTTNLFNGGWILFVRHGWKLALLRLNPYRKG